MPDIPDSPRTFILVGNLPCLDLVNTRPLRHGQPEELLRTFSDLVAWLEAAGILTATQGRAALKRWDGTSEGGRTLRRALALREELRSLAERTAAGGAIGAGAVRAVNRILASRPAFQQLVSEGKRWKSEQRTVSEDAIHLLVPVAESAAWLIEHGDPALLRKCEDPACVLYFYDTTKNKRRRWCSMDGCGSRAKAAAYYRRERKKVR
ncbi:MAG: ABATE domain-containing protein [Gemmatimonadota bacterium]